MCAIHGKAFKGSHAHDSIIKMRHICWKYKGVTRRWLLGGGLLDTLRTAAMMICSTNPPDRESSVTSENMDHGIS